MKPASGKPGTSASAKAPSASKAASSKPAASKGAASKPAATAKPAPKPAAVPAKNGKAPVKPAGNHVGKPDGKSSGKPAGKPETKIEAKVAGKGAPAKAPVAPAKVAAAPVKGAPPAKGGKVPAGKSAPAGSPAAGKPGAPAAPAADAKGGRKGITIVTPKPVKKAKPKPRSPMSGASSVPSILGGRGSMKPLIPSGPAAVPHQPLGYHGHTSDGPRADLKSPFGKKELAHFRQILLQKRVELVRDVSSMESEALKGESGSLSSVPQHMAEQGSENYDQSLSLDLAAADRKLIKEIDDALVRIDNGTFGICELTGKPIKVERLEELPWARYSIEAARDLERRQMRL